MNMISSVDVDDLETAVLWTRPRNNNNIRFKGLYDFNRERVYYRYDAMENLDDFYVTILHELAHYWDDVEDSKGVGVLSEIAIETCAIDLFRREEILEYMGDRFRKRWETYNKLKYSK